MKYLLIVSHPDDEVLGAGGSIYKWTQNGDLVAVAIMSSEAKARSHRPDDEELESDMHTALALIGVKNIHEGTFPNIEMNTVPHLKLVQFIESVITEELPDIIITHHPSDLNNDHQQTSIACQAAVRIFQRRPGMKRINELWFMEVPSSTEWNVNTTINGFRPNCFVEIGEEGLSIKLRALGMYRGVMRPFPHPRSAEYIRSLAIIRGAQWNQQLSESFEVVLRAE